MHGGFPDPAQGLKVHERSRLEGSWGATSAGTGADPSIAAHVQALLESAVARGASDIHLEGSSGGSRVRLRIDGLLQTVALPADDLRVRMVALLKVLGGLDIGERRLPQDGRLQLATSTGQSVDFRISTLPTLFGEKVVLRLIDPLAARRDLGMLGMEQAQRHCLEHVLDRPQGLVLVTGPTGSGKTATLYAALSRLNTDARNISTVEDPVEVILPGINQVQRNARAGLDFASALRALLRQDPDVLMIGEIRDAETAAIAIRAAQTGHLVLSSLHTNDAPQAVARLLDMGIPAYNLAAALSLVIAQRLVRCLCPDCRQPCEPAPARWQSLGIDPPAGESAAQIHSAAGCDRCTGGYRGRTGIYQVMPFTAAMAERLLTRGHGADVADLARQAGIADLRQAALRKVFSGTTSLEELVRITSDQ